MNPGRPGHRAPLLWLLLPLMAGLATGKACAAPSAWLLASAALMATVAMFLAAGHRWFARHAWPVFLSLTVIPAGAAYFQLRLDRQSAWESLPPREARLRLRVERTFPQPGGGKRTTGFAVVTGTDAHLRDLAGQRLYFSLQLPPGRPPPLRSAEIQAIGLLDPLTRLRHSEGFDAYIVNAGMAFKFTRGRLLGEAAPPSRYQRFCHAAERRFHAILGTGLAGQPALAAILRAMMLGQKQEMSEAQQELFMHSGTMHLFAISGLNVTAVALSVQTLLILLRLPRLVAAGAGLAALWLYVDITGTSPSAVRAFLMCALFIVSFSLRRPGNALAALTASALLILLLEPMQLFSASFQMSYGIVAVLLLLGWPLAGQLQARWPLFAALPEAAWGWHRRLANWIWRALLGMLGIGLAAALVSTVSSIQFFQLFTPGALLVNLLLIPLSTLVIGAGFLSLLCGLAGCSAGSAIFNHAGALLLWLMDASLRSALTVPGVYQAAQFRAAWLGPVFLAGLMAACLAGYAWHWRRERGGFWPPFVLVALLLILGVKSAP
ncbi:MAG: ComEC/Rec2 family competence protein [Opitutaceae bacterium]|nr:ComEC/Rec2 family competence protein [Opitutaceae bacterium]